MMSVSLLIDTDILLYKVSIAVEEAIDWGEDLWTLHGDLRQAKQLAAAEIEELKTDLKADRVILTLTDPKKNWRHTVMPTYKSNRRGRRKPVVFVPLREYLEESYETATYPTLEADDVMGIMANDSTIIVSDDKDLKSIPGKLFQPSSKDFLEITPDEADRFHLTQTLTGDTVDGYGGCPGIGPVKADRILQDGTWDEVLTAYTKAGLGKREALKQARVARILRSGEYNIKTGKVKLWNPI
jgi:DNA polymerase-1